MPTLHSEQGGADVVAGSSLSAAAININAITEVQKRKCCFL